LIVVQARAALDMRNPLAAAPFNGDDATRRFRNCLVGALLISVKNC
jgi:hypothetical protein